MTNVQRKFGSLQGNSSLVQIRFVVSTNASFLKNRMLLSGLEKSEKQKMNLKQTVETETKKKRKRNER